MTEKNENLIVPNLTNKIQIFDPKLKTLIEKSAQGYTDPWRGTESSSDLRIWRINNYRALPCYAEEYGHFFEENVYLILKRFDATRTAKSHYDIHVWTGKASTIQDYLTAISKMIQLDAHLGQQGALHRHIQSKEGKRFRQQFDPLITWNGHVKKGFRALARSQHDYAARLLQYFRPDRRSTHARVKEVDPHKEVLDPSYVFILDLGKTLIQWNGSQSSTEDILATSRFVQSLRSIRGLDTRVENISQRNSDDHIFYFYLKDYGYADSDDDEFETINKRVSKMIMKGPTPSLHAPVHNSNELKKLKEGRFKFEELWQEDWRLFDSCDELFVCSAVSLSLTDKKAAFEHAHEYLAMTSHPLLPISFVTREDHGAYLKTVHPF